MHWYSSFQTCYLKSFITHVIVPVFFFKENLTFTEVPISNFQFSQATRYILKVSGDIFKTTVLHKIPHIHLISLSKFRAWLWWMLKTRFAVCFVGNALCVCLVLLILLVVLDTHHFEVCSLFVKLTGEEMICTSTGYYWFKYPQLICYLYVAFQKVSTAVCLSFSFLMIFQMRYFSPKCTDKC